MSLLSSILYFYVIFFVVLLAEVVQDDDIEFHLSTYENGKICSPWVHTGPGPLTYIENPHHDCISEPDLEQKNDEARLCCESIPLATPSTNFPRECGKQRYVPLMQRIIGGTHAIANSWVSSTQKNHSNESCFLSCWLLAMASFVT